jgi:hypothetical protein
MYFKSAQEKKNGVMKEIYDKACIDTCLIFYWHNKNQILVVKNECKKT